MDINSDFDSDMNPEDVLTSNKNLTSIKQISNVIGTTPSGNHAIINIPTDSKRPASSQTSDIADSLLQS